ncbi:hypothetical protein [uncultured Tateyamaria sp.]|uniref:hypothetical protein n=1 Tax=uncultured Tateyamaria sp. TaxID=455651 RepID=UPI002632470A|nr:hypothetical protein [uncultured Tateyamaria sp.]
MSNSRTKSSKWKANMSDAERETREALVCYKSALIDASHRGWTHRFGLFVRNTDSIKSETELRRVRQEVEGIVNSSAEHRHWLKQVVSEQPVRVRDQDSFTDLLQ